MSFLSRVLFLSFCFSLLFVFCSAAYDPNLHRDWSPLSSIDDAARNDGTLTIMLALKQSNRDVLEKTFWDVSNPKSKNYAKYLNRQQIAKIVAPSQESISTVLNWLEDNHAFDIDFVETRDAIKASFKIPNLESALNVKFSRFLDITHRNRIILRSATDYQLPSALQGIVELIHGVSDFPMPSKASRLRQSQKTSQVSNFQRELTFLEKNQEKGEEEEAGQPTIVEVSGRGGQPSVSVLFIPTCKDGSISDTITPCEDHGPQVSSVLVEGLLLNDVHNYNYSHSFVPGKDLNCYLVNSTTFCTATLAVNYYNPFSVRLTEVFSDDSVGPSALSTFPVVITPPVTPQTINALYSIPDNYRVTQPKATQAVAEFEEQYYTPDDLVLFFQQMGLYNDANVTVIGPNDVTNPGVEANLDIQYLMGIALDSPTTFWSIPQNTTFQSDDILRWAYEVGNYSNPPLVHSISYGQPEDQVEPYFGKGYLQRSDAEFMKLALQGITIVIACGDTGAGDLGPPPEEDTCTVLHPDWPSQSPYVTAVGTTFATPNSEPICYRKQAEGGVDCDSNPLGEVSVSLDAGFIWTTGGGFSNVSARPDYQRDYVEHYLSQQDAIPPLNMFNRSGRAYPDFAAIGHNIIVAQNGSFIPVDGTSCSAPIFSAIVTLLNNVRISANQPPLGFINPLFYQIAATQPAAFRDVVIGNNRCGAIDTVPSCCSSGFSATVGWDAISGLGTPNFDVLSRLVLQAN